MISIKACAQRTDFTNTKQEPASALLKRYEHLNCNPYKVGANHLFLQKTMGLEPEPSKVSAEEELELVTAVVSFVSVVVYVSAAAAADRLLEACEAT